MNTKNVMKVMGFLMVVGCIATFLFIDFHNKKISESGSAPKKISYDEVHEPSFNRINSLIAAQENKNVDSVFIGDIKKELLDLRITKEIHQHVSNKIPGTLSTYPLLIIWSTISVLGFILLRAADQKEKSINRSYEKILDHLEISYSQDHQSDKNLGNDFEQAKDFRRTTPNEEV
jgi:hypothetical protein